MTRSRALHAAMAGLLLFGAATAAAQTPTTLTLTAPSAPTILGQAASFAATVAPAGATGRVLFREGATVLGEAPLNGLGTATFTLATLSTGRHEVSAEYLGDGVFGASGSAALAYTVDPRPTTLSLSSALSPLQVRVDAQSRGTVTIQDASPLGPPGVPGRVSALPWTMNGARTAHTATRLWSGLVLVAGGRSTAGVVGTAERFDPMLGTFTRLSAALHTPRQDHTATLLQDGTVLIAGGRDAAGAPLSGAELYDPATGEFTALTGGLQTARYDHAAVLLADGSVLLLGGVDANGQALASAELFRGGAFHAVDGTMQVARAGHTATLLGDGASVLVTGGVGTSLTVSSSVELVGCNPAAQTLTRIARASWSTARTGHTATLLPDGGLLVAGGTRGSSADSTTAVYRLPADLGAFPSTFTSTQGATSLDTARGDHAAVLLLDGRVLLTGGMDASARVLTSAASYRPGFEPTDAPTVRSSDPTDQVSGGTPYVYASGPGAGVAAVSLLPTAVGSGSRTLTVGYGGDANHTAPTTPELTISLRVLRGIPSIDWYLTSNFLYYGARLGPDQLDATASSRGTALAGTFSYDPPAGTLLSAGYRMLSVTFRPADTTNYEAATGSTYLNVLQATPLIDWSPPQDLEYGTTLGYSQLTAQARDISGPLGGTYTYSPSYGTLLRAGTYALYVTFTPYDTTNYKSAWSSTVLVVRRRPVTLQWSDPSALPYGTPLSATQLCASAAAGYQPVEGTFTYSPPAGTLLPLGAGQTLSVTFTPTDTLDYETPAPRTVHLDVVPGTPAITWEAPAAITYGTALSAAQLDASATGQGGPLAGTFRYTPDAGALLSAGLGQTLSLSFTPADPNYASTTRTTRLDVLKAIPIVTWAPPAPIEAGTALGPDQLDATFTWEVAGVVQAVPGTAIYTPPAGTTLLAGDGQALGVHFIPDDVLDFDSPQDVFVPIDVSLPAAILPATARVAPGVSLQFSAWGGAGAGWTWTVETNRSGATITADGLYTAGETAGVIDVVRVQDPRGHSATATVTVERGDEPDPVPESGGGGCGSGRPGASSLLAVGLLLALGQRRRRRA